MRMMAAMIDMFCDSFDKVPRRILLDIDDTVDRVHGGQQLALFNAHHDSRCFLPIHIYEATTGKPPVLSRRWWKFEGGVISGVTDPTRPAAGTAREITP